MRLLLVALGGAIGSGGRYLLSDLVQRYASSSFPYGTFVVNATGCLMFGVIVASADERFLIGSAMRTFLLMGVIGGFTTFSSFSFESVQLARNGEYLLAAVNGFGQLVVGFVGVWLGYVVARVL
jgi:fluoride exporter